MPKCVFSALVLSMVLPSIAAAQSAQSISGDLTRLAYVSPQRARDRESAVAGLPNSNLNVLAHGWPVARIRACLDVNDVQTGRGIGERQLSREAVAAACALQLGR